MTARPLRVLLIGCGAIGGWVAERIAGRPDLQVTAALVRADGAAAARAALGPDAVLATDFAELTDRPGVGPDVALECAGHAGLTQHGATVLGAGIDLGVVSIGALAEQALAERLEEAARAGGASLTILSGALAAVDALASARLGGLDRVVYTGRKPPRAWIGTPADALTDLSALTEAFTLFEGSARAAARAFPKNANVAATIGLAGLGLDETAVRLIADPAAGGNTHEIRAEGAFGTLQVAISGRPLATNPKSSALTAMSAARFLLNRTAAVRL